MSQELVVDEAKFTEITNVDEQYDSLKMSNPSNEEIDVEAFIQHLQHVQNLDQIEHLTINYNSSLNNLNVLRAFTNLRSLSVYGQYIQSLEGIEWFSKGEYIQIQTYRNRRRDLSQLVQTNIKHIDLYVERAEDLLSVAGCKQLKSADIYCSKENDFSEWSKVTAERISFKRCKFTELGDMANIPALDYISVIRCRSLERFIGDNSNIKRLVVDSCNKLDLRTLRTFERVEALIVNSCKQEMNLTEIGGLEHVKHIDFILCNVQVDFIGLKDYFPNIESLHISGMKKERGLELKAWNPDVRITSRSFEL
ncbi:hypothetical protein [Paenibacillus campinasensis]|uniref:Leucine-rich repeat domain-containing protein n=1 Tax=Paenibacillus campinasensis TaxID=66347 RepID=A0A268EW92_9BACL|nr:hypothetical protein [Paenibacillus campinasensis]PAD77398.1 hypothetical protein CHH67_10385 [Paenibacillus campinasensis]